MCISITFKSSGESRGWLFNNSRKYRNTGSHEIDSIRIFLCVLVKSEVKGNHDVIPFNHGPGVHFESLGKLSLSNQVWKLVTTTDITPLFEQMQAAESYLNYTTKIQMAAIPEVAKTFRILSEKKMSELRRLIHSISILMKIDMPGKKKRGLFNGFGQMYKTLFGVMDNQDRELITKHMDRLDEMQTGVHDAAGMQVKIINSTISQLIAAERTIEENEKLLFNTTRAIEQRLADGVNNIMIRDDLDEHLMVLTSMMEQTYRYAAEVRDLLINGEGKLIHPCVIDEEQLLMTLRHVVLPTGYSFPVGFSIPEMLELEKLSETSIQITGTKIITIARIPLLDRQMFDVYRVHGVPTMNQKGIYTYVVPSQELLVIDDSTKQFVSMSREDLGKCFETHESYLCKENFPVYNAHHTTCETELYTHPANIPASCEIRHAILREIMLIKMSHQNSWIFVSPSKEELKITCVNNNTQSRVLEGSGIITVQDYCRLTTKDFVIQGGRIRGEYYNNHVLPKFNLTLDNDTSTYLQMVSVKIPELRLKNVINHVDELEGLQVQLQDVKDSLDNNNTGARKLLQYIPEISISFAWSAILFLVLFIVFCIFPYMYGSCHK